MKRLLPIFNALNGKPFGAIRRILGTYKQGMFKIFFLRIQGSPGADPASIAEISFDPRVAGFSERVFASPEAEFALADFLIRRFNQGIIQFAKQNRGADGSGSFHTITLGQTMLERDSVKVADSIIILRFIVSFPSRSKGGGSFDGGQAKFMIEQELGQIMKFTFLYTDYPWETKEALEDHIQVMEDRKEISRFLEHNRCISFISEEAVLPRRSGVDDRPMVKECVNLFQSPETLSVEIPMQGKPPSRS